jgi:hypothetical protein
MPDVSPSRAPRRIGHKGADLIAPGNTLARSTPASPRGVDMIEFDVLSENIDGTGRLLLAHDYGDAARRAPVEARGGAGPLRSAAYDGSSSTRLEESQGIRAAGGRRAARHGWRTAR